VVAAVMFNRLIEQPLLAWVHGLRAVPVKADLSPDPIH